MATTGDLTWPPPGTFSWPWTDRESHEDDLLETPLRRKLTLATDAAGDVLGLDHQTTVLLAGRARELAARRNHIAHGWLVGASLDGWWVDNERASTPRATATFGSSSPPWTLSVTKHANLFITSFASGRSFQGRAFRSSASKTSSSSRPRRMSQIAGFATVTALR